MTENKRFTKVSNNGYWSILDNQADYENIFDLTNPILIVDRLNELADENKQLKSKNRGLQSELQIFKEDVTHSNLQINKLADENEQLKKDKTNLHRAMSKERVNYFKFRDKVFDLIDKKIKEVDTIGAEVLKDLRRELKE